MTEPDFQLAANTYTINNNLYLYTIIGPYERFNSYQFYPQSFIANTTEIYNNYSSVKNTRKKFPVTPLV